MNRRDRVKRYLAMLLAFTMIFQQAGITTIADETEAVVAQQSEAAETKVQASAPETSAPETKAPETQAPETKAPETSAPETKAPETSAPETKAPETSAPETKAPETPAAVTSAPATEAQGISEAAPETQASEKNETTVTETQAPETGAASEPETKLTETETLVTEAPETQLTENAQTETAATEGETEAKETETETESETETEAPKTNHFAASFVNGKADVTLSEAISEKAQFIAEQKSEESAYFDDALNIVGPWLDAKGLTILDAAVYDMHFEEDGKEIAVNQKANVNMQFASPILTMEPETGIQTQVYVLHIVNGNVEDAGTVTQNGAGAVTAATIQTNGFSPFVFVKVASGDGIETADEDLLLPAGNGVDLSKVGTGNLTVTVTPSSIPLDRQNGSVKGKIDYKIPNTMKDASRKAYYKIPVEYLTLNDSASGNVYDASGRTIGSYTLNKETGDLVIQFTDTFYNSHTDIEGYFNFNASVKTDAIENKNEIDLVFPGYKTVELSVKPGEVTGGKKGEFVYGEDGNVYVDYTVTLNADCDLENFEFTDQLGENLEFVNGTFTFDDVAISPAVNGNTLSYNLDKISKGTHTFKCRAKVKSTSGLDSLINKASWKWKGSTTKEATDTRTISDFTISKAGGTFTGRTAKWTVRVTKGTYSTKEQMGKAKYEDMLPEGMTFDKASLIVKDTVNNKTLVEGTDYTLTETPDGKFSIQFMYTKPENVPSYEITYDTTLKEDENPKKDDKYNNTGTFTPDGEDGKSSSGSSTYDDGKDGRVPGTLTKHVDNVVYDEAGNAISEWTLTVDPQGKTLINIVVKDEFGGKGYTRKDTAILKDSIEVFQKEEKLGFSFEAVYQEEVPYESGYVYAFTIKLTDPVSEPITVRYKAKTFAEGVNSGEVLVINNANAEWDGDKKDQAKDSFVFKKRTGKLLKIGRESGEYYRWDVFLNLDPATIGRDGKPAMDYGNDPIFFEDILPEGMELVTDAEHKPLYLYAPTQHYSTDWGVGKNASGLYTYDNGRISVTFPKVGKSVVIFTYYTKIKDGFMDNEGDVTFTNNASYSDKDGVIDTGSYTIEKKGGTVTKDGVFADNKITYTVTINPKGVQLNDGKDLTFIDKIPDNCTYVPGTLAYKDGSALVHKYKDGTLTATIPDGTSLKLVYEVKVNGKLGENVTVTNTVVVRGKKEITSTDNRQVAIQETSAGASGKSDEISIHKVDEDNEEINLSGAKFKLQRMYWNEELQNFFDDPGNGAVQIETTNENGYLKFTGLLANTLYYYQELEAPSGYVLDSTKYYFHRSGNDDAAFEKRIQTAGIVAPEKMGDILVSNEAEEKGSLIIRKTVEGADATGKEFQFTVKGTDGKWYQEDGSASDTEYVLKVKANESITLSNLPVGTYTVEEKAAKAAIEGYNLSVTGTGNVTIAKEVETSVNVTNKYVLEISITVTKAWKDGNNQDGKRPESIKVQLYADGKPSGEAVTLSSGDEWTYTWSKLPEKSNGQPIAYTVEEVGSENGKVTYNGVEYTVEITGSAKEGYTITNSHTPATIEASVEKTWDDNDDQDGKRPEKLLVTLMRRIREQAVPMSLEDADDADINPAEEVMTVELTAANGWKASVSNQSKYKDGQEYEYFWTEKNENIPEGYKLTSKVTGNTVTEGKGVTAIITSLTNTHTPETTDISVTKVWEDNNNKAGVRPASIQVQLYADETQQGNPVELNEENSWKYTWKDLDKYADGTEISYRVDEVGETDGYLKSVASKEGNMEYVITNTITSVKITKVDISDAHELEGAHLQILDSNGTVVTEWDSAKEAHEVTGLKTGELYTLRETVAPDGYTITTDTTFELDEHGKLKEDKTTTNTKDGVLLVEDTATSVKVRKVDITNAEELPGAHIQIWEKTSEGEKLVTEWDSTKEDKVVEKLKTNTTYILRETVAPDGYTITTDTTFELDEHGKLKADKTTTNTKDGVLLVEDARTVEVSKVDLGTGEELDGAHIQVLDKAGNVVDEWDSKKGETHKVKNLTVGQEYTLRETVAPNGYTLTTDTTFTIDRTGKVTGTVTINKDGVLLVEDTATRAEITKLDAATEAPLSGAVLRVIDANGTAVDEWTTDGQPHVIEAKLNTGATYQLIEVKAPDGYEIADPISFTMKADGTTDPVVMKDAMTRSEKASVSVTKKLTFSGEEISAVDATFYVALYADEACTKRISEIMPLVFKKASSATVTFTNVEIGRTYYVGECDANGVNLVSGVMAGNVAYAAIFANGNKTTVTEADGTATVYFENQFATIPDGFYKEGILTITKKLLGSDKKAKNSNEIFYAGIFSDAAYTQLSGDVSENIVALDLAGGSEAEAEVLVAIAPGGSQTLYVTEVDANGKPVAGAAGFKYTVQVDKTSVTLSEANTEAHVTITNTETETETESETKKTTSVKTGDDTPIAPYMALMFASMAMLAAEFICRRKRRSEK